MNQNQIPLGFNVMISEEKYLLLLNVQWNEMVFFSSSSRLFFHISSNDCVVNMRISLTFTWFMLVFVFFFIPDKPGVPIIERLKYC